jgi:transcriptional regulator with XRE-family HTH domain
MGQNELETPETDVADDATERLSRRVHELRRGRQWTLEQMASASGVSRSMLSQIERNEANPTFNVAYRIARAFGMSLGELVDAPDDTGGINVIRMDDESFMFRDDAECSLRTLFPLHLAKNVEFYELKLRSGCVLHSSPHMDGTSEFVTVQKGNLTIRSGDHVTDLSTGDSAHYAADVAHSIENTGRGEAVAFLVAVYQSQP